jgi:hypothetical protein
MIRFQLTHTIRCDVETYWKTFFDPAFNTALYHQTLAFPAWEVTELRETATGLVRRVAATPKVDLPGPVVKLIGPNLRYTEEGTFERAASTFTWVMKVSAMADKIDNGGKLRVEAGSAPGECRRIVDLHTSANIFMIGSLMESTTEKSLREGWEASAKFHNEWLARG